MARNEKKKPEKTLKEKRLDKFIKAENSKIKKKRKSHA